MVDSDSRPSRREFIFGKGAHKSLTPETPNPDPDPNFIAKAFYQIATRRQMLETFSLGSILGLLTLTPRCNLPWSKTLGEEFASKTPDQFPENRTVSYSNNQLFTKDSGETILEKFGNHSFAYVIVHAGYTEYSGLRERYQLTKTYAESGEAFGRYWERFMNRVKRNYYGDYNHYLHELTKFKLFLESSNLILIVAQEERDFYSPLIPLRSGLAPNSKTKLVVTPNDRGFFSDEVQTLEGVFRQEPDLMFEQLREAGVREIRLAGEWSFADQNLACLGGIANEFRTQGFQIRGIKGLVFPTIEPAADDMDLDQSLYLNAHTLP